MTKKIFSPLFFVAVFGSGIRDGKKSGSGIRDKHPGYATLVYLQNKMYVLLQSLQALLRADEERFSTSWKRNRERE
jgi:hypothetical protein